MRVAIKELQDRVRFIEVNVNELARVLLEIKKPNN
jgi:hypothetical protein